MPAQLHRLIDAEDSSNHVSGVIENLAWLLRNDGGIDVAYLCTAHAVQVFKLRAEGAHFCGYRNIQMLCLTLAKSSARDMSCLSQISIPQLQRLIEAAWDQGINDHGRVYTGGIEGTRKHIGTSEAEALLLSLSIPCTGTAFHSGDAVKQVLDYVEAFFTAATLATDPVPLESSTPKVHLTTRLPIFLQCRGHSITVVGIERTKSGSRRLLTFDPAWQAPSVMRIPLTPSRCNGWQAWWCLKQYRKSERYLHRSNSFETLVVLDQSLNDGGECSASQSAY